MRNNNFNFLFVACVWASTAAADHSFLRSGRKLEWCEDIEDNSVCRNTPGCEVLQRSGQHNLCIRSDDYNDPFERTYDRCSMFDDDQPGCRRQNDCEVLQRSGAKNLCVDSDDIFERTFERCSKFNGDEEECWGKYPDCVWRGRDKCEDRSNSMDNGCTVDKGCEDDDEICVPLQIFAIADPCLANDFRFGQCIRRPRVCPSTNDEVCGCNGETYNNSCESLMDEMNVMYNDSCSRANENAFRQLQKRYMREHNIDDGDHTDEYLWAYMRGSVRTDGNTCLNEFECKKQSIDIGINNFIVTSDPYNW